VANNTVLIGGQVVTGLTFFDTIVVTTLAVTGYS